MEIENKKILVIGDTCKDVYIYGKCERLCPDAPVPVLIPKNRVESDGMAGNVVRNAEALGIKVNYILNKNYPTKIRYVDQKTNQMLVRVDEGEYDTERIFGIRNIDLSEFDAIIISDYNKGFLMEEDIKYICDNHNLVFIDTKKIINSFCENARFIKINDTEYQLSKQNIDTMNLYESLIVTTGSKGAIYKDVIFPVELVEIKDQTGAGDTFMASLVVKYLETSNIEESIKFANRCASWVVTQRGVNIINVNKI